VYSSIADVRNALAPDGSSTDPATAAGLSDDQVTDAIHEADGIVDSYIGSRYAITQDTATPARGGFAGQVVVADDRGLPPDVDV
jgi:hypothetical protein